MSGIELLEGLLRDIDKRRSAIDAELDHEGAGTYRRQELELERQNLMALRSVTDNQIRASRALPPPPDERRARLIECEVRERKASTEHFIAQLERQGDYAQARIWRLELLRIHEQVEAEFSK